MDNAFSIGKRAFAVAVAAATIVWSVGLAAFAVPTAQAAASEGDLIKGTSLSTVYFYGYDGQRYTFPNEKTYFSWFEDFSDVETITDGDLADIDLAGNVVVRPGTYWIKVTSDPDVFAVSTEGTIRLIETVEVAEDLAGSDWNAAGSNTAAGIIDVPDAFFADYSVGASLMTADAFDGAMYMDGGDYYLSWDGEKRLVTDDGMDANNFESRFFLDGSGIDDSDLTAGDDIDSEISALTDASQMGGDETSGGDLTVSLASSTPSAASVPNSATGVEVATFKFVASSAATLSALTVELTGLVDTDAILSNGVYLYEGSERLTDGRSVNSSTRTVTFASLGLDFTSSQTRYLTVVVDMDNSTVNSGSFSFKIDSADDVDSDGDVSGSFPITGNTMSIEDLDVGSITIEDTGSLSNPSLGESDAVVAKFKLTAGSAEDLDVNAITLNVNNASDHTEFTLWNSDEEVATGEDIGSDLVLFEFTDPFFLEAGDNETFEMTVKVGGEVDDTIVTSLENSADMDAVGRDYGFGVTLTNNYDGGAGEFSTVTVQGGDVTFAFNGPSATDVKDGADDFTLFEFSVTAERWVEIDNLPFDIAGTDMEDTNPALTDLKIMNADSGALVLGPEELDVSGADDNDLPVVFTDALVVEAGETLDLVLTADMDATVAAANDTYTATLDIVTLIATASNIEDEAGDAVTDVIPGSNLAGYAQTVQSAALTVGLASTPTGDTSYVKGSSDVEVVGYTFTAGNGSDLNMTDLTVVVYVQEDSDGGFASGTDEDEATLDAADRLNSCSLYDDSSDTLIAGPESITDATGVINFESFSYEIPAGESETAVIKCNLANVAPGTADEFAWEIENPTTDITVEDDEGDTLAAASINAGSDTNINDDDAVKISVTDSGTLAVTAASDAPDADYILAGSSSNTVSKFRFDAANEAFIVNRLTVTEEQAEADNGTADSAAYANNVSSVTISYPMEDGTTGTASGSLTGNEVTFNSVEFYVPKDDDAAVTVKATVAESDRHSGSSTSNEKIRLGLSSDVTNEDQFRAVGQSSGVTLDDDDTDNDGVDDSGVTNGNTAQGTFVVRETVPTVSKHSSSPSGSDKTPGDQEILRFTVAANSGEDLVLNQLIFTVSTSDNDGDNWDYCDDNNDGNGAANDAGLDDTDFDIYNLTTTGVGSALDVDADWTLLASDGTTCTEDTDAVKFVKLAIDDENVVPAGSSYTYALYIDTTYASSASNDSIQIGLAGDPILSTYLDSADDIDDAACAANESTCTADDGGDGALAAAGFAAGDLVCLDEDNGGTCAADEEVVLVTDITGDVVTMIRGYLGRNSEAIADNSSILYLPGAFNWEDDGNETDTTATEEWYGAHLVDTLPVTGNAIGF